jgi:hypothetical protein
VKTVRSLRFASNGNGAGIVPQGPKASDGNYAIVAAVKRCVAHAWSRPCR